MFWLSGDCRVVTVETKRKKRRKETQELHCRYLISPVVLKTKSLPLMLEAVSFQLNVHRLVLHSNKLAGDVLRVLYVYDGSLM